MNKFLKSKRLYMLLVLPILVILIAFASNNPLSISAITEIEQEGYITIFQNLNSWSCRLVAVLLVLGIMGLLFWINERFKLLQQTTTLPLQLYLLLIAGVMFKTGWEDILVAVFVLAFALDRLQVAISNINSNGILFDFGASVMLSVLIYPKLIFCIVWALCATIFSGRSTLKDITALFLGFVTPLFFLASYYFVNDRLLQIPEIFSQQMVMRTNISLSWMEWVSIGILLFVLLIALLHFLARSSGLVLVHRRMLFAMVSMLFFLVLTSLFFSINNQMYNYVLALPSSLIYAYFFLGQSSKIVGNVVFILFLTATGLPFFA